MPPEGPELQEQRDARKAFDTDWPTSQAVITGSTPIDPLVVNINTKEDETAALVVKSEDEMLGDAVVQLESKFIYD